MNTDNHDSEALDQQISEALSKFIELFRELMVVLLKLALGIVVTYFVVVHVITVPLLEKRLKTTNRQDLEYVVGIIGIGAFTSEATIAIYEVASVVAEKQKEIRKSSGLSYKKCISSVSSFIKCSIKVEDTIEDVNDMSVEEKIELGKATIALVEGAGTVRRLMRITGAYDERMLTRVQPYNDESKQLRSLLLRISKDAANFELNGIFLLNDKVVEYEKDLKDAIYAWLGAERNRMWEVEVLSTILFAMPDKMKMFMGGSILFQLSKDKELDDMADEMLKNLIVEEEYEKYYTESIKLIGKLMLLGNSLDDGDETDEPHDQE